MNHSRNLLELLIAIAIYMVVLIGSLKALNFIDIQWLKIVVSLTPMLPALAIAYVIIQQFKRFDELQQKIQLHALGMSFVGTSLITFSYGFLENVGFPKLTMFVIWPMMAVLWSIATAVGTWKYR
ncbi:hypothetical protein [Acinetobacter colistiniresistens]|uniref:Uncharacterized protein n=1 Tax=Acinetobacter colistiniresistens TaxID=280145 RepID=S3T4U3_9GAMM|nr:hypothetical protein [Acinetobacter colistiniresistens]EPG35903.1 hypothetical protein F907_02775 [Acinetobacter colistiniresistens]TVT83196.1 hypothetical protein FPV60_08020 [Acinetobacter colistiniresistens]